MNMQQHILTALREEFAQWEELLAGLSEAQLTTPATPGAWTIKDEVAHLWAWQQRSLARLEAARLDREPEFPAWPAMLDPEADEATDQLNAWLYAAYREQPWAAVYQAWRAGVLRCLAAAEAISERDFLDGSRYAWLEGHPLAVVLLASYDHHQEHLEELQARLSSTSR